MTNPFIETLVYTVLPAVLVFGVMIIFHELGHFAVAKLMKIQVYEFSIGFGPKVYGFVKGETFYNLRAFPLGGFVRMAGMDPEEDNRELEKRTEICEQEGREVDFCVDPQRGFAHKSIWQRIAVIAAGPLMNFVLAILLYGIIFSYVGQSVNVIDQVLKGQPAYKVGLHSGDRIVEVNKKRVSTWDGVAEIIHANPNKKVNLVVVRAGKRLSFNVVPKEDKANHIGLIGISPKIEKLGAIKAIGMGADYTWNMVGLTFGAIGKMFAKEIPVELSGPIGITREVGKAARMGILPLLNLAGFLSIQIGLFNLFPIPALDGSRIMFLGVEGVRGRPIDPTKENFVHLVGLGLLLLLMAVVTYKDIVRLIS